MLLQTRDQLSGLWSGLSLVQRITIVVIAVATIGLLAFLATSARNPRYATVFSGLAEADAGAIVEQLQKTNTPYQLANNGATIQVPADQVAAVRLAIAKEGILKDGQAGYELFDTANFGITDFAQKLNFRRSLEGELSRTISSLASVQDARVHLVLPEERLFASRQAPPSASVTLHLKQGRKLSPDQVDGIVNLVAASVEGLKAEQVTVVDSQGNLLSTAGGQGNPSQVTAAQLAAQKAYEQDLQQQLTTVLTKVLGPDKAAVQVAAELAWDRLETTNETYAPPAQASVRSAQELTEKQTGQPARVGGAPGTDANTPTYQNAAEAANGGSYEKRQVSTNYELSKKVEKLVKNPGSVKRLSVAVILDDASGYDQAQLQEIERAIRAAAGLEAARGDQLSLSALPFDRSAQQASQTATEAAERQEMILQAGRIALLGVLALAMLLIFRRVLRRPSTVPHLAPSDYLPRLAGAGLAPVALGGATTAQPAIMPPPTVNPEQERRRQVHEQVTRLADLNPELFAQLVGNWLDEDKSR